MLLLFKVNKANVSFQGTVFGQLFVFDRDTTPSYPKDQNENKLVGTLMTNDTWIKDTFTILHRFREEKAMFSNVRGTVHEYSKDSEKLSLLQSDWFLTEKTSVCFFCPCAELRLNRNISVEEKHSFRLDYLVNDTTYPGADGTVMLHFNITILPVSLQFSNTTYFFALNRRSTMYSKVFGLERFCKAY